MQCPSRGAPQSGTPSFLPAGEGQWERDCHDPWKEVFGFGVENLSEPVYLSLPGVPSLLTVFPCPVACAAADNDVGSCSWSYFSCCVFRCGYTSCAGGLCTLPPSCCFFRCSYTSISGVLSMLRLNARIGKRNLVRETERRCCIAEE